MNRKSNYMRLRELGGIFLLCLSSAALSPYIIKMRDFEIRDVLFLAAFVLLSLAGVKMLDKYIKKEHAYLVYLILFCELFLRSTLYGRFDFFEYTIFEAEDVRAELFFRNKVNTIPFHTVGRFFSLSLLSRDFIVNIMGNALILTPIPIALYLAFPEKKHTAALGVLLSFLLSLSAELLQLFFMCGSPDVDDLILNTLGGLLGAAMVKTAERLKNKC